MWKPDNVYIDTFIANIQCIYEWFYLNLEKVNNKKCKIAAN